MTRTALLTVLLLGLGIAPAMAEELHGESAVFARAGLVIAWGILRGPNEGETQAVLRVTPADRAPYHAVAVDAVDPFGGARRAVLTARPIGDGLDVWSPRETFADFPRREVRFFRTAEDARGSAPSLVVYYLGVPDTTPEFATESALLTYLADAVARARVAAGKDTP